MRYFTLAITPESITLSGIRTNFYLTTHITTYISDIYRIFVILARTMRVVIIVSRYPE